MESDRKEYPRFNMSLAFKLDKISGLDKILCYANLTLTGDPVVINWVPGSASFSQATSAAEVGTGIVHKYVIYVSQVFEGSVIVDSESSRKAIENLENSCNTVFLHRIDFNAGILHGTSDGVTKPVFKSMKIDVYPKDWAVRALPFEAKLVAICAEKGNPVLCNYPINTI